MNSFQSLITKLFKAPSNNIFIQFFRYLFVGGTAFVVDFGLLYVFTDILNIHYLVSAGMSFVCGLLVNYFLSISWVFSQRKLANRLSELLVFAFIGCVGLALTSLLMWLFTDKAGLYYLLSKIITTVVVMLWNFLARKFTLF